jgi:hypothetical protein
MGFLKIQGERLVGDWCRTNLQRIEPVPVGSFDFANPCAAKKSRSPASGSRPPADERSRSDAGQQAEESMTSRFPVPWRIVELPSGFAVEDATGKLGCSTAGLRTARGTPAS